MQTIFFSKIFCIYFQIFSNLKTFWFFFANNFTIKEEKTFSTYDLIWYAFYTKFATFTDFEKHFSKKNTSSFSKNLNFVRIWEILLFQSHFNYDLVMKNFQIQNLGILSGQFASKRKNRKPFEWMIFLSYYKHKQKATRSKAALRYFLVTVGKKRL